MQQSLHLLQAPLMELRALVQQEIETNPVLEEPPAEENSSNDEEWQDELQDLQREDEAWRDYFSQTQQRSSFSKEDQERRQFLFDSQVEEETLVDHLIGQLSFSTSSEDILRVGEEIIGNLDADGFLRVELKEIAQSAKVTLEQAEQALALIQTFHPPGIAARDLRETLLIQIQHRGKQDDLEYMIVRDALAELGRKKYQDLARRFSVSLDRIQEAAFYISKLQPRPGAAFSPEEAHNVVQPEAAIVKVDGVWTVQMNHDPMPKVRINDTYKDLLGQADKDPQLRDYLKEKIRGGKFLIKCLHQRQDTIESILKEIVQRQNDFFEQGTSQLKPLTMNQVAQVVGVHETTVSRAIANKYVQTPWGILPIKFFFNYGFQTSQGESMANTSIKEAIQELVDREDTKKPLSDSEIVTILSERGIPLARRTVAKYRAELKILPSNLRKEL